MWISLASVTYESVNSAFGVTAFLQKTHENAIMCIDPKCFCLKRALNAPAANMWGSASFGGG